MAYKIQIELDEYEKLAVRKVRKLLIERTKGPPPSINSVIRGLIRIGMHGVYGEETFLPEVVSEETLRAVIDNLEDED